MSYGNNKPFLIVLELVFCVVYITGQQNEQPLKNVTNNYIPPPSWDISTTPFYAEAIPNWTKPQLESLTSDVAKRKIKEFCSSDILVGASVENFLPSYGSIGLTMILTKSSQAMFPKQSPHMVFRSTHFNLSGNVTVFFTGWQADFTNTLDSVYRLHRAYKCLGNQNLLIVETGKYVQTLMEWATYDYRNLSMAISQDMVNLLEKVDLPKIHLIGHGVGAHVAGLVGRYFHNVTGKLIPRITGLDPANSCLQKYDLSFGLQKGDAEFVDIIHTNPQILGSPWATGDADFYLTPPSGFGCSNVMCEHHRAIDYYAQTVASGGGSLFGCKSLSLDDVHSNNCFENKTLMGFKTPNCAKGNFIVTNVQAPSNPDDWTKCVDPNADDPSPHTQETVTPS